MEENNISNFECTVDDKNNYDKNIEYLSNRFGKKNIDYFNQNNCHKDVNYRELKKYCKIEVKDENQTIRMYEEYEFNEEIEENCVYIVYGFGMGYYIYDIFKKINKENYLLIIEPDENIFKKALQRSLFKEMFSSDNVYITVGSNIERTQKIIKLIFNYRIRTNYKFEFIPNAKYKEYYNEFYDEVLVRIEQELKQEHGNLFPLMTKEEDAIGKPLFQEEQKEAYYTGYYDGCSREKYPVGSWAFYNNEILYGKKYTSPNINIPITEECVLPILVLESSCSLKLKVNDKEYTYDKLIPNRYNYFPINELGNVNINSNSDIVLGRPISLMQNKKHKVKLVLYIFIDGLAKFALGKETIEASMPNTASFFENGVRCNNCYFNAEWTLPSVPTLFSGKYACKNGMYHPDAIPSLLGEDCTILSEYFQKENYLTFQMCGDWRKSPSYGYVKGFDRTIYKREMDYKDVIFSFLEQMRAFKNRDQFGWISLFDLHDLCHYAQDIGNQIQNSLEAHNDEQNEVKSVYKEYNKEKSEMFLTEARKLDFYLKIIYDYIEENYNNDEVLVVLCTDHGQSYLGNDVHPLNDSRAKIPLLMKGRGVPKIEVNEFVENVDVLPTILNLADIEFDIKQIDGRIPKALGGDSEKAYVYYESIFPGKPFKAIVRDKEHKFFFETKENVLEDGRIRIGEFKTSLVNISKNIEESSMNEDKNEKYTKVVLKNIKNITILSDF